VNGKYVKRNGRGLFLVSIPTLVWNEKVRTNM
jgi:hypothetical protein